MHRPARLLDATFLIERLLSPLLPIRGMNLDAEQFLTNALADRQRFARCASDLKNKQRRVSVVRAAPPSNTTTSDRETSQKEELP